MNKTYRLVWNSLRQRWVAVGEHARSRGKRASTALMLGAFGALGAFGLPALAQTQAAPAANALPTGGQVVAGQATITSSGNTLTINQGSSRTGIDWQRFDVGSQATVNFVQPGSGSVALNRIEGNSASQVFGHINANGQVFLSNPNGVYFAPSASVDVGGLVATTHSIGLAEFMAGHIVFERDGATGSVVNEGQLRAALGGYIALLAPQVRNQGVILARMGTVALAAGETFELQFDGNNTLAGLRVTPSTIAALVDNRSAVLAPGGLIILSAQALDKVQGGVIQNSGRIEASGLKRQGGRIVLDASTKIENTGRIAADASADGPAGSIGVTAPQVVNAGTVEARGQAEQSGGTVTVGAARFEQKSTGVIDVSAPVKAGRVQIHASAQAVVAGKIDASATQDTAADGTTPSQGGQVEIEAAQVTLANATVDASGGTGGQVLLDASAPTRDAPGSPSPLPIPLPDPGQLALDGSTVVSSRGRRGNGGSATLLGDDIGLNDGTHVDASGATGGGTVLVGGDWHGGVDLHQATSVAMASGASIDASALVSGNGGTVVLWSQVTNGASSTLVDGSIAASGAQGGLGGQVETSGHRLGIGSDASVRTGAGGNWLLDPADVTISSSDSNYTNSGGSLTPSSGASSVTISASTVAAALASGNVTITTVNTGSAGTGNGNITVSSAIAKTSGSDSTLTLEATGNLAVNANITSTSGKLNLVLISDFDSAGAGAISISGATLDTNGGKLWAGGNGYGPAYGTTTWEGLTVAQAAADSGGGGSTQQPGIGITNSSIRTGGGDVSLNGLNDLYLSGQSRYGVLLSGSTLSTGSGNVSITGKFTQQTGSLASEPATYGVDFENSSLQTTTGSITVVGGQGATEIAFNDGLFGIRLLNSTLSTSGATGDINLTGVIGTDNGQGGTLDGIQLSANGANASTVVSTVGGSIFISGTAYTNNASPSNGIELVTAQPNNTNSNNPTVKIVSQTGNVTLTGDVPNNTDTGSVGILFNGYHYGQLYVGYDGTNAYSGNTTLTGRSIQQTDMASGDVMLGGSGALTLQPTTGSFTAGASTAVNEDFNVYWTFGGTHGALTLGRDSSTHVDTVTVDQALTAAGPIAIYAGNIDLNDNLAATAAGAGILLKAHGNVIDASNVSLTTNGGPITFWANSDGGGAGYIFLNDDSVLDSRTASDRAAGNTGTASGGGAITLGGGTDLATGYAVSNGAANRGGIDFGDQTADHDNDNTIYSGGGAVVLRGESTGTMMGIDWNNSGTVNAGSTGTIALAGLALDSTGHGIELGAWHNTGVLTMVAGGGNASTPAITLVGTAGPNGGNGIQSAISSLQATGTGGISVTGNASASGSVGVTGTLSLLAASGAIGLNGGTLGLAYSGTLGAQSGTAVTSSSSPITLSGDVVSFGSSTTASSGALTIEPNGGSFSSPFSTANLTVAVAPSSLTLGKAGNTGNVTMASAITVAGPVDIEGGIVDIDGNLTSTATGNILIKANSSGGSSPALDLGGSILKTGGSRSTLTLESAGEVLLGSAYEIQATGTVLDTVFWSDYDNTKNDGGVSLLGNVGTNGGNLWAGGSSSNGGSYGWNGLAVGNGPSVGATNFNANALVLGGSVATGGGQVLLWAGSGSSTGTSTINSNGTGSINAGSGNVTLIAAGTTGTLPVTTTGTLTLAPNGGGYAGAMTWNGSSSGGNLTLNSGTYSGLVVENVANVSGLAIGTYSGMSSGGSPVAMGNTSDVTLAAATAIGGPIEIVGGNIAINAGLSATNSTLTLNSGNTVTENASGYVAANALLVSGGAVTMNSNGNAIGSLAAAGVGGFSFVDGQALTIGSVGGANGIAATGLVNVGTLSGDLTVARSVATSNASNAAIVLNAGISAAAGTAAGGDLLIGGSAAISVGAGGTAQLYTGSVSGSTGLTALVGAGSGRFRYDSDESSTHYTLALAAGLDAIYREQPSVTRSVDNQAVGYGDTPTYTFSLGGDPNGDTYAQAFAVAPTVTVGGSFSTGGYANAGTHGLSGSGGSGTSQLGLGLNGGIASGTLTVTPRSLTATYSGTGKVYDGSTAATVTDTDNRLAGDQLSVGWTSATFNDANAGTGKAVGVSGVTLSGADAGNYLIAGSGGTTATIAQRTVTLTGGKVYDGTATLGAGDVTIGNLVGGQALGYSGATASGAHVATSGNFVNAITLTDGSGGGLASNYQLPALNAGNAPVTIAPLNLTASAAITGSATKSYDGTVAATGASLAGSIGNAIAGDTLVLDASGVTLAYNSAHVANANQIAAGGSVGFSIAGSSSGSQPSDYALTQPVISPVAASIAPATLTATLGNTGVTKTYDGSTSAPVGFVPSYGLSGLAAGDTGAAIANSGAAYDNKNVVGASLVTVSGLGLASVTGTLGSQPSDYALSSSSASVAANITPKPVSVSGLTVSGKTYDGTDSASITNVGNVVGTVGGETLGLGAGSASFSDPNAGTGKTATASGYAISNGSGANAGLASNYQLGASTATATADIAKALLTVSANNDAKFVTLPDASGYNGVSISGFVNGETGAVLSGAATVSRSNAGTQAAGSYNGVLVADTSGLSAANYSFQAQAGNFTIVPSNQLLVQVANSTTVYGSAAAYSIASAAYFNGSSVVSLGSVTDLGGGRFTVSDGAGGSATFTLVPGNAANSGAGLTAVGSYQLAASNISSQNAQNFSNALTVVGSETVTAKGLGASATNGLGKVYDGSTAMLGITLGLSGLESGDSVTVNGNGAFSSANAGTRLGYTISGIALVGADAADYYVTTGSTLSGNNGTITPRTVTLTGGKVYDGTTTLGAGDVTIGNLVDGQTLGYSGATASGAHVATSGNHVDAITLADGTGLASNYQLPTLNAADAPVTITPKLLSPTASIVGANSKTYDGTTTAVGASIAGSVAGAASGDTLALDTSGITLAYDTAHVVSASQIAATGTAGLVIASSANGSLASDYGYTAPAIAPIAASIAPRGLTVVYGGIDKVYDGQATATVTTSDNRIAGDALTIGDTANFVDKNVGSGKTVNVTGVTLGGASASDYTVGATGGTTANITQLATVTWVGGSSGNWFNPANWAGGAVPDLANVAAVVIPANVSVSFNTAGAVGAAQTGPVHIDSLGAAGKLVQSNGELDVGNGGITLDSFEQSGGVSTSLGPIALASLTQTGGSLATRGALTVGNRFSQTGSGRIEVGGDADIANASGGASVGNLAVGGNLGLSSPGGDIVQAAGTAVTVTGGTAVDAGTHDVSLGGADNGFGGPVSVSGHDITWVDGSGELVLGNVQASGDLSVTSTGGGVSQASGGTLKVSGTSSVTATGFDISLDAPGNFFGGALAAGGRDITLVSGGPGLTLGDVAATGNLDASTASGDLTQAAGTSMAVAGTAGMSAHGGWVKLSGGNSIGATLSSLSGAAGTLPTVVVPAPVLPATQEAPHALAMPGSALDGSAAADAAPMSGADAPDPGRPAGDDRAPAASANTLPAQDVQQVTVRVLQAPSDDASGSVEVSVPTRRAALGFRFALPDVLTQGSAGRGEIKVARADGKRMPRWIRFDRASREVVATAVPRGGLPLHLMVSVGGQRTALGIVGKD